MTRRGRKSGFTLLEVLLALAILVGSLAVLGELANLGTRNARAARDLSIAQLLCESKWAEIAAGITPAENVNGVPCGDSLDDMGYGWFYSVSRGVPDDTGLTTLEVTVTEDLPSERHPTTFSLFGWITDPNVAADEAAAAEAASASAASSDSSSSSGSSNSGASSGGSSSGSGGSSR